MPAPSSFAAQLVYTTVTGIRTYTGVGHTWAAIALPVLDPISTVNLGSPALLVIGPSMQGQAGDSWLKIDRLAGWLAGWLAGS
jgi:hypothetical protein